ncbi:hypothetical protein BpHYR1_039945 [Brachionus plicatilis]|uniref:Uncharacterized protein n=1 Tax=Brachionus plicatilis TaxID=10195 RepID=A0A3M7PNE3_BRAPC|nr:hypothetical protein BpHYR1_039945 [Brachionus plicatilis]
MIGTKKSVSTLTIFFKLLIIGEQQGILQFFAEEFFFEFNLYLNFTIPYNYGNFSFNILLIAKKLKQSKT